MAPPTSIAASEAGTPTATRARRAAIWALLLAGLVLALVAVVAIWVERDALDTDHYVENASEVLESENVQDALSSFLVERLYADVDVADRLRARLPPETKALAAPVAAGLREFAVQATERALGTGRVQDIWRKANRRVHEQLVLLLEDESRFVRNTGGRVVLDLRPLVVSVGDRVGVGGRLNARLPPDAGRLVIIRSDQLESVQTLTRILRFVAHWFWLLAFACWAAAIWLARGRRRETLKTLGIAVLLLGVLVLVVRRAGGNVVVDRLVENESASPAVKDVWGIFTRDLRDVGQTLVILGIVAILGTWLAGAGRQATRLRRRLAPYLRDRPDLVYGAFVAVFLLVILWAPTGAFRRPFSLAVMAVLVIVGIEALRREAAREFPDEQALPLGLGDRLASWRSGNREAAEATVDPETARLDRLERLAALRDRGVLSEEEFAAEKTKILAHRP
ncbi:MAG: SHOCT domain-containing protein [Thermoleophilia bacterium]|nr:SHOCT domain-containing protein [Thermoleophilia bacterium]